MINHDIWDLDFSCLQIIEAQINRCCEICFIKIGSLLATKRAWQRRLLSCPDTSAADRARGNATYAKQSPSLVYSRQWFTTRKVLWWNLLPIASTKPNTVYDIIRSSMVRRQRNVSSSTWDRLRWSHSGPRFERRLLPAGEWVDRMRRRLQDKVRKIGRQCLNNILMKMLIQNSCSLYPA